MELRSLTDETASTGVEDYGTISDARRHGFDSDNLSPITSGDTIRILTDDTLAVSR